jgi:hypothetical protein
VVFTLKPNKTGSWSSGNHQPVQFGFVAIVAPNIGARSKEVSGPAAHFLKTPT